MTENLKHLGWVVAGGLFGVAVACLTSPLSGNEFRRRVRRRMDEHKRALSMVASG